MESTLTMEAPMKVGIIRPRQRVVEYVEPEIWLDVNVLRIHCCGRENCMWLTIPTSNPGQNRERSIISFETGNGMLLNGSMATQPYSVECPARMRLVMDPQDKLHGVNVVMFHQKNADPGTVSFRRADKPTDPFWMRDVHVEKMVGNSWTWMGGLIKEGHQVALKAQIELVKP